MKYKLRRKEDGTVTISTRVPTKLGTRTAVAEMSPEEWNVRAFGMRFHILHTRLDDAVRERQGTGEVNEELENHG